MQKQKNNVKSQCSECGVLITKENATTEWNMIRSPQGICQPCYNAREEQVVKLSDELFSSDLYSNQGFLSVGKNYHAMLRDVDRLLIMANEYITYRLEWEMGLKPKEKLTLAPIRKLQASINKTRRQYHVKGILVLDNLKVVNTAIRNRQSIITKCDKCGKSLLKIDLVVHVDAMFFERRYCRSCADALDETEPIQVCPVCKEPYDESYSACTCEQCGFCGEGFHLKDLEDYDGELLCKGCLEIAKDRSK